MSGQPNNQYARKIFLSYASVDSVWKDNFTDDKIFANQIGRDVELVDYGDLGNFGPVTEWLEEQIALAAAVIVFVSKDYIERKYTLAEFWKSLEEHKRRKLVFVPVMMDAEAIGWWTAEKRNGQFQELLPKGGTYAFAQFTYRGRPQELYSSGRYNDGPARRVGELAQLIGKRLDELATGVDVSESGPREGVNARVAASPESVQPPIHAQQDLGLRALDDNLGRSHAVLTPQSAGPLQSGTAIAHPEANLVQQTALDVRPTVLLGHPDAEMAQEVAGPRDELEKELIKVGLCPTQWSDKWSAKPLEYRAELTALIGRQPVFIQPVNSGQAGELAKNPQIQRDRLKKVLGLRNPLEPKIDKCRIYIWLPRNLSDDEFDLSRSTVSTLLTNEAVSLFAERLKQHIAPKPGVPVIMLEELTENEDLRSKLAAQFRTIVESEVAPPLNTYAYDADLASDMLEQRIAQLEGDRVILAIHDLNVGPATNTEDAQKKLEQKLGAHMQRVRKAQNTAKKERLKIFWSALVVRNEEILPWVKYPSPQYANWHLLGFFKKEGPRPDPLRSSLFCNYLREWAHT